METGRHEEAQKQRAYLEYLNGMVQEQFGQWDTALESYKMANQLDSSQTLFRARQGLIYAKKHLHKPARNLFDELLAMDSTNVTSLYGMALIMGDQKKHRQAIAYLQKAIEEKPDFAEGHFVMAVNYYFLNDIETAWQHIRQAQNLGMLVKRTFLNELKKAQQP